MAGWTTTCCGPSSTPPTRWSASSTAAGASCWPTTPSSGSPAVAADELHGQWFWDVLRRPRARGAGPGRRRAGHGQRHRPPAGGRLGDRGRRSGGASRCATRCCVDDDGLPYAIACVGVDVTADRRREELLHQRAQTDLLTGIANRGALFEALHRRLEEGPGCALLFCDLDQFKAVNDEYGHAVGDRILAEVAARLVGVAAPGDAGRAVRRRRVRHPLPRPGRGRRSSELVVRVVAGDGAAVRRTGGTAVARGQRGVAVGPRGGVGRRADRPRRPGDVRGEDPSAAAHPPLTGLRSGKRRPSRGTGMR